MYAGLVVLILFMHREQPEPAATAAANDPRAVAAE
jgi:hypothetical protein